MDNFSFKLISHAFRHFDLILLKMMIKKVVIQLEKFIGLKFAQNPVKFYANRRNFYIHVGLDKSLFSFENYKEFLVEVNKFLSEHLHKDFASVYPPKLVLSTKRKHDYIIYSKGFNG